MESRVSFRLTNHAPPNLRHTTKMNTYIIENKFTGYRAEIKTACVPAVATLKKHLRAAKARDCRSTTTITNAKTGDRYEIADMGRGEKVLRLPC